MLNPESGNAAIPNIDLGRTFDLRYEDEEVYCESLGKLAEYFGRNMRAHRHDRVYQAFLLIRGEVHLHLDDHFYHAKAPLFFLTPPSVTHAFTMSEDAEGHVLSVRQQLIWRLYKSDPSRVLEQSLNTPMCVEVRADATSDNAEARRLLDYFELISSEFTSDKTGRELNILALTRLTFVAMARLSSLPVATKILRQSDVHLFRDFNQLIEEHFKERWPLKQYADALSVTESRLNDICRRVSDISSKRLVHDRLLQEAKRQLLFSAISVSEIAYDLGFKDVSYFSRFFRLHSAIAPGEWRDSVRARKT